MSVTHIVAKDNIGLSVINDSSKMLFDIPSTHKNDKNKILKLCIDQIIEDFNPSEPYLFYNKDNIIKSIALQIDSNNDIDDIDDDTITIQINSKKFNIYKLKIFGIITEPIYYLCTSQDIFNDIYEKILSKYKNCNDGTFTFNFKKIELFTPLDKLKFEMGCGKINEITFETNVVKTTTTYTKYRELFDAYKIIDECDDYIIQLDYWYGNKKVFIKSNSYLYYFKYNLLKKFLDAKLINDKDLNEINLTPYLKITTKNIPCCKKKYKKYDKMKIKEINIKYTNDCIFFYIDDHVHYTLLFKKGLHINSDKYTKIINEELNIFQIITTTNKPKEKIPSALRNTLWSTYFDNILNGICQCCKIENISKNNFDCGHIISEKNGGTVTLKNLRPICRSCNSSMGIQNMDDFITNCGFDKGDSKDKIVVKEDVENKKVIKKVVKEDSDNESVVKKIKNKKVIKKVVKEESDNESVVKEIKNKKVIKKVVKEESDNESVVKEESDNESIVKEIKNKKVIKKVVEEESDNESVVKKIKNKKVIKKVVEEESDNESVVKEIKNKKVIKKVVKEESDNESVVKEIKNKKVIKKVVEEESDNESVVKEIKNKKNTQIICRMSCGNVFSSTVTRQRHEKHHCVITKEQNIESEKIKNIKYENEIKLLKQNLKEYKKISIENSILTKKNKTLMIENKTLIIENKALTTDLKSLTNEYVILSKSNVVNIIDNNKNK
jgi:hypothetical protein